MKLLHISDWHCQVERARLYIEREGLVGTDPDIVLISGDMLRNHMPNGRRVVNWREVEARLQRAEWLEMVDLFEETWPNAELVAVPGNHDFCNLNVKGRVRSFDRYVTKTIKVAGIRITGFRGVPFFFGGWDGEFADRYFDKHVKALDSESEVVLTHTPPWNILDRVNDVRVIGLLSLQEWFERQPSSKRRIHAFGHVHECGGQTKYWNGVTFSNAAGTANWLTLDR